MLGIPGYSAYGAAKAGVRATARIMASELSPRGIRVDIVAPGAIRTPIWGPAVATPEAEKAFEKRIALSTPLGRLGEPDHISKTVLFPASDDSAHVQGLELFVDGGATASAERGADLSGVKQTSVIDIWPAAPPRGGLAPGRKVH